MSGMVWHPANLMERAMAWALSSGDYAGYFRAFTRADLFLPRRPGDDPDGPGEPVTGEAAGHTVLPVFTSDEGLLAALGAPVDLILVVSYQELRDDWPSPRWRLAINPGLPIEAYLPVDQVDRGVRGELTRRDPDVVIGPLADGAWEPWPPGGADQALLDAVSRGDGPEYLDALRDCAVTVPTTRPVSDAELDDFARVRLHHPGPGPVDDRIRQVLVRLGVPPDAVDREFPWRFATGRPEPTVAVFTRPEFHADAHPRAPSVRMRFSDLLRLLPAGHALSVNPGGPAGLDLPADQVPLLRRWERIDPVPAPVLRGMRWARETPVRIVERRPDGEHVD